MRILIVALVVMVLLLSAALIVVLIVEFAPPPRPLVVTATPTNTPVVIIATAVPTPVPTATRVPTPAWPTPTWSPPPTPTRRPPQPTARPVNLTGNWGAQADGARFVLILTQRGNGLYGTLEIESPPSSPIPPGQGRLYNSTVYGEHVSIRADLGEAGGMSLILTLAADGMSMSGRFYDRPGGGGAISFQRLLTQ